MKKKILAVLLAYALAAGTAAGPAGIVTVRAEEGQEQVTEDGLVYEEKDEGITITGYIGIGEEVVIPDSILGKKVIGIGEWAFQDCRGLTSINAAEGNENYASEDGVLYDKEKTNLICCPEGKEGLLIIPDGVTSIEDEAFLNCSGLTSISIPKGVTFIEDYTFQYCSGLTSVNIPEGMTSIGAEAFSGCSGLTSINVAEGNEDYASEDGVLYDKEKTCLICCPAGKEGIIVIPAGVTRIGEYAFQNCSGLTSISIPEGVTSIGREAFSGCSGLTSVSIPEGVTIIEFRVFGDCSSLTSVSLPEGVTSIGNRAFERCSSLTSVSLPARVTIIGDRAFWDCSSLTSVNLPAKWVLIGEKIFSGCSSLKDVYYAGSQEQWERIVTVMGNDGLESATIHYGSASSGNGGLGGSSSSGTGDSSYTGTGDETIKKTAQSVTANDITATYGAKGDKADSEAEKDDNSVHEIRKEKSGHGEMEEGQGRFRLSGRMRDGQKV